MGNKYYILRHQFDDGTNKFKYPYGSAREIPQEDQPEGCSLKYYDWVIYPRPVPATPDNVFNLLPVDKAEQDVWLFYAHQAVTEQDAAEQFEKWANWPGDHPYDADYGPLQARLYNAAQRIKARGESVK